MNECQCVKGLWNWVTTQTGFDLQCTVNKTDDWRLENSYIFTCDICQL